MEKLDLDKLMELCKEKDGMYLTETGVIKKIYDMFQKKINNYHLIGEIGSGKSGVIDNVIVPFYENYGYKVIKINVSDFDYVDSDKGIDLIYRIQYEIIMKNKGRLKKKIIKYAAATADIISIPIRSGSKKSGLDLEKISEILKNEKESKGVVPRPKSMYVDAFKKGMKNNFKKSKILIILDELDRSNPNFANNIIEFSKHLNFGQEFCSCILSYDEEIIHLFLIKCYNIDNPEKYLDKYNNGNKIYIPVENRTEKLMKDATNFGIFDSLSRNDKITNAREIKNKTKKTLKEITELFKKIKNLENIGLVQDTLLFIEYQLAIYIGWSFRKKKFKKTSIIINQNEIKIEDYNTSKGFFGCLLKLMEGEIFFNKHFQKIKNILDSNKSNPGFFTSLFIKREILGREECADEENGTYDFNIFLSNKVDIAIKKFDDFVTHPKFTEELNKLK